MNRVYSKPIFVSWIWKDRNWTFNNSECNAKRSNTYIKIWISSLPYSFICPDWKRLRMKKGHKWNKWPRSTWVMKRMAKETKRAAGLSENPDGEVSHLVTCWMLFREKLMNVRLLHLLNTRKIRMSKEHHLIEPNHLIPLLGLFSIML